MGARPSALGDAECPVHGSLGGPAYDRLGSAERLRRIERQIFRSAHSKAAIPLTAKIGRLGRSSEGPLWVESRHSN
jgi:hypothetical protein